MARVGQQHFAENWQKKSVREEGNDQRRQVNQRQSREAARVQQQQLTRQPANAKGADRAQSAPEQQRKPGRSERQVQQQTVQKARPETQDQAARQSQLSSQQFLKARADAQNLKNLASRTPQATSGREAATKEAVTKKGEPDGAQLQQQQPEQATSARLANAALQQAAQQAAQRNAAKLAALARKPVSKGKATETKKGAEAQRTAVKQSTPQAARGQQAARATAQSGQGAIPARAAESGVKKTQSDAGRRSDGTKKKGEGARTAGGRGASGAAQAQTGRQLGGLMSGLGHEGHEALDPFEVEASAIDTIVEEDAAPLETVQVFNEYDTTRPGIDAVLPLAQRYRNDVEKRQSLNAIAQLDEELEGEIRDRFETARLSDRLQGELANEITTADFLYKTVYGGLIG